MRENPFFPGSEKAIGFDRGYKAALADVVTDTTLRKRVCTNPFPRLSRRVPFGS